MRSVPKKFRTLFISDLHLGYKLCLVDELVQMLDHIECESIYLLGDILDETRLVQCWYWPSSHQALLDRLSELANSGVAIFLVPGNHDPCFREPERINRYSDQSPIQDLIQSFLRFEVSETFIHTLANGKRILLTHGDLFDDVHENMLGIPKMGSRVFDWISWWMPRNMIIALRAIFKLILARPRKIEQKIVKHARNLNFDGLIFGHLHEPMLKMKSGFLIGNCGDWTSHQSWIIEDEDGGLRLFDGRDELCHLPA